MWPLALVIMVIIVIAHGMTKLANKISKHFYNKSEARAARIRHEEKQRVQRATSIIKSNMLNKTSNP